MRKTVGVGRGYSDSMAGTDQNNLDVWDTWLSGMTFGVGERADGEPWIFLEHVEGGSLPVLSGECPLMAKSGLFTAW